MGLTRLNLGDGDSRNYFLSTSRKVPLSSEGLQHLAGLAALQELSLAGPFAFQEGALQPLSHLERLQALDLSDTHLPSLECLRPLERLPLQWLRLPKEFGSFDQLPRSLRVPAMRGSRQKFEARASEDLLPRA